MIDVMAKQLSFFVLPDELVELEEFIKKDMQGVFIMRTSPIPEKIVAEDIFKIPYLGSYITPKFELDKLKPHKIKDGLYGFSSIDSTVIEFDQSLLKENVLRSARLLYESGCYHGDDWVDFSSEYITWCENVFKWIKKKYKPYSEMKGYRISQSVLNMVKRGELKLSKV